MSFTLADLDIARQQVLDCEVQISSARARIESMVQEGLDTASIRAQLEQLEQARREYIERLGAIRGAIGLSAT